MFLTLNRFFVENSYPSFNRKTVNVGFTDDDLLSVYPNPATDIINFKFEANRFNEAEVYSLDGKVLMKKTIQSENQSSFDVSNLIPATYFIKLSGTSGIITKVFVK